MDLSRNVTKAEMYKFALDVLIEKELVPTDTPIVWVDRMLNEMIQSSQRISEINQSHGAFEAIYFIASKENQTKKINDMQQAWKQYCLKITYVSVDSSHLHMLDAEPAKIIASNIDVALKRNL